MEPIQISKTQLWTGRVLSGLVVLFMLMDGGAKLAKPNTWRENEGRDLRANASRDNEL